MTWCRYLRRSEKSSSKMTSCRYCGGERFTTLCAVLSSGDHASLWKMMMTLAVGRRSGYFTSWHLNMRERNWNNNPEIFVYTVYDSLAQFSLFLNLLFIGGKLCSLTYLYHQTHSMFSLILQRAKQWDRETWASLSLRQLHCFPCPTTHQRVKKNPSPYHWGIMGKNQR